MSSSSRTPAGNTSPAFSIPVPQSCIPRPITKAPAKSPSLGENIIPRLERSASLNEVQASVAEKTTHSFERSLPVMPVDISKEKRPLADLRDEVARLRATDRDRPNQQLEDTVEQLGKELERLHGLREVQNLTADNLRLTRHVDATMAEKGQLEKEVSKLRKQLGDAKARGVTDLTEGIFLTHTEVDEIKRTIETACSQRDQYAQALDRLLDARR